MSKQNLSRRARLALAAASAGTLVVALPVATDVAGAETETETAAQADEVPAEPVELLEHCPLAGPSTFEDSWGWARSGGRSHEGVDMMADRGVPVIAVRDGDALFKRNRLGGNAVWLTAPNGDKFYYAHLDGFEGESRTVEAGEVIGYNGSTGNAGSPHLHFETLPGGRVENPYPHTADACIPTLEELAEIFGETPEPNAPALTAPTVR